MLRRLSSLGAMVRWVLGLVLPVFQQTRGGVARWGRGLLLVLHLVLVVAIVIGLHYLNEWLRLHELIPTEIRFIAHNWLPILFLLIYSLCWLSWLLWQLLVFEPESSDFPDIDQAWQEALAALRKANLDLLQLPMFLILGRPQEEEKHLFQAGQLSLEVKQAPARAEAPLHVYATRRAIYVTCPGASLLGVQALSLAGKWSGPGASLSGSGAGAGDEDDIDEIVKTMRPGGSDGKAGGAVQDLAEVLRQAEREGRPLNRSEKRELRRIYRRDNPQRSPLRDASLVSEQSRRLHHLCRLLVRARHPCCPINGILLLIPFAGTDHDDDAADTAAACQRDLAVTATALKVHCPLIALVCDLETAPGFSEFIQHFSAKERLNRLGRSCPLVPDLSAVRQPRSDVSAVAGMLHGLAEWICQSVVQSWVYEKFQLEGGSPGGLDAGSALQRNSRLFQFFDELQQRDERLGKILTEALAGKAPSEPLLLGGCYLGGTGADPAQEQAFVKGVFDRLVALEECVYWTEQARAEEEGYQRWVNLGWTALAVLALGAAILIGYTLYTATEDLFPD
jgi:hypothetical protein